MQETTRWPARAGRWIGAAALVVPFVLAPATALADGDHDHDHDVVCVRPGGAGNCYASIQAALDAVEEGGTVLIHTGTYAEDVHDGLAAWETKSSAVPGKSVTLRGADGDPAVIDASGKNWALELHNAAHVTIEHLTFENANFGGVLFDNASEVQFRDNHVTNNDKGLVPSTSGPPSCPALLQLAPVLANDSFDCGEGVTIAGLANSTLSHNLVNHNVGGILVSDEDAPTHNNEISDNTVRDNPFDCGITLASHSTHQVFDNRVMNNTVASNGAAGVGLFGPAPGTGVHNNLIWNNTITNNAIPGVTMHSHAGGQNMNGNAIIGNTIRGNGADTEPDAEHARTGIEIFAATGGPSPAEPVQNTLILLNTIRDEAVDVWVGANATSAEVHLNNLLGGSSVIGVQNGGSGTINAQANYWGCPTGPSTDNCTTTQGPSIQTTPFLPSPIGDSNR